MFIEPGNADGARQLQLDFADPINQGLLGRGYNQSVEWERELTPQQERVNRGALTFEVMEAPKIKTEPDNDDAKCHVDVLPKSNLAEGACFKCGVPVTDWGVDVDYITYRGGPQRNAVCRGIDFQIPFNYLHSIQTDIARGDAPIRTELDFYTRGRIMYDESEGVGGTVRYAIGSTLYAEHRVDQFIKDYKIGNDIKTDGKAAINKFRKYAGQEPSDTINSFDDWWAVLSDLNTCSSNLGTFVNMALRIIAVNQLHMARDKCKDDGALDPSCVMRGKCCDARSFYEEDFFPTLASGSGTNYLAKPSTMSCEDAITLQWLCERAQDARIRLTHADGTALIPTAERVRMPYTKPYCLLVQKQADVDDIRAAFPAFAARCTTILDVRYLRMVMVSYATWIEATDEMYLGYEIAMRLVREAGDMRGLDGIQVNIPEPKHIIDFIPWLLSRDGSVEKCTDIYKWSWAECIVGSHMCGEMFWTAQHFDLSANNGVNSALMRSRQRQFAVIDNIANQYINDFWLHKVTFTAGTQRFRTNVQNIFGLDDPLIHLLDYGSCLQRREFAQLFDPVPFKYLIAMRKAYKHTVPSMIEHAEMPHFELYSREWSKGVMTLFLGNGNEWVSTTRDTNMNMFASYEVPMQPQLEMIAGRKQGIFFASRLSQYPQGGMEALRAGSFAPAPPPLSMHKAPGSWEDDGIDDVDPNDDGLGDGGGGLDDGDSGSGSGLMPPKPKRKPQPGSKKPSADPSKRRGPMPAPPDHKKSGKSTREKAMEDKLAKDALKKMKKDESRDKTLESLCTEKRLLKGRNTPSMYEIKKCGPFIGRSLVPISVPYFPTEHARLSETLKSSESAVRELILGGVHNTAIHLCEAVHHMNKDAPLESMCCGPRGGWLGSGALEYIKYTLNYQLSGTMRELHRPGTPEWFQQCGAVLWLQLEAGKLTYVRRRTGKERKGHSQNDLIVEVISFDADATIEAMGDYAEMFKTDKGVMRQLITPPADKDEDWGDSEDDGGDDDKLGVEDDKFGGGSGTSVPPASSPLRQPPGSFAAAGKSKDAPVVQMPPAGSKP